MSASSVCALVGCPNLVPAGSGGRGYCQEHVGIGEIISYLDHITGQLDRLIDANANRGDD